MPMFMNSDNTRLSMATSKIISALRRKSLKGMIRRVQRKLYKGKTALIDLEKAGLQIVPFNFYSPIPSVSDIEDGWEAQSLQPFFEPELYNNNAMREFLQSALVPYAGEFNPGTEPTDGENENNTSKFYWNNSQFSHSDALSLYCFLRHVKPKRVIEIGGGFSTLIIEQAIKINGFGEIWEVEPYPRPFLQKLTSITKLFDKPVQQLPLTLFDELQPGDVLFIDSTHTVKTSSDCVFIYLKALKRLKKEVFIHSHDIFLPDIYPKTWSLDLQIYWNEQYLLQAFLLNTEKYRILYGSNYHRIYNKELLDKFMAGKARSGGGSFWYKKI